MDEKIVVIYFLNGRQIAVKETFDQVKQILEIVKPQGAMFLHYLKDNDEVIVFANAITHIENVPKDMLQRKEPRLTIPSGSN